MRKAKSNISRRQAQKINRDAIKPLALRSELEALEVRENPAGVYTGVAFQDYDSDGIRDLTQTIQNGGTTTSSISASIDNGVSNVIVRAFNAAGAAGTTTTTADGTFTITPTGTGPYRFEFSLANLPAGYTAGPEGLNSKTTVQFVADGGGSNLDVGLVRTDAYSTTDPLIVTSIFNYGNPQDTIDTTNNPNFRDDPAIRVFRYSDGGTSDPGYNDPTAPVATVPARQVGAVFGLGVNQNTRDVYASAYFRRFAGYGPGGSGAIYRFNLPENVTTNYSPPVGDDLLFADLNAIFSANTAGVDAHDTVDNNNNGFADDYESDNGNTAWDAVGKTGLGGLDVSQDGQFVFVVNLADRQVYRLPTTGPLNNTTVLRVPVPLTNLDSSVIIPSRFESDDIRPFALRYYQGEVYVGVTYTAETRAVNENDATARAELMAGVYRLNPLTMTFDSTPIFTTRLNYARDGGSTAFSSNNPNENLWRPWRPEYFSTANSNNFGVAPQPMLSDLAFDAQGNLTLGLRDRGGDQNGFFVFSDAANPTRRIEGFAAGDILKAFITTPNDLTSGWVIENNARGTSGQGTQPQNTNFGPGGGEFYSDTFGTNHFEVSVGAVLQVPGRPDIINTQYDPGATIRSGGVAFINNTTTGSETKAYNLYISPGTSNNPNSTPTVAGTFGKANGIGGLAGVYGIAPVEIGNRIWLDSNADGIQTPGENGLEGVLVQLFDGTTVVAEATTDTNGNYYFSSALGTDTDAKKFGLTLIQGTTYTVRVPNVRGGSRQSILNGRTLTRTDNDATTDGDLRDSDATLSGNNAVITYVAGAPGQNNHTFDVGFTDAYSVGNRVWRDLNDSGTIDGADSANGANLGIGNVVVRIYNGATTTGAIATVTTDADGYYLFDGLPAGNYTVEIDRTSTALSGLTSSTPRISDPNANTLDSQNHGVNVATNTVRSGLITLGPGDSEPTTETDLGLAGNGETVPNNRSNLQLDFGFISPAVYSVGGNIFFDSNNDGDIASETLITGQPITLVLSGTDAAGNPVSRTVTTTNGSYNFTNLPASNGTGYTVTQFNQPTGFLDGKDKAGTPFGGTVPTIGDVINGIVIASGTPTGTAGVNYNFGELLPASLGNFVWLDVNGNGRQDGGAELGIDGITVTLNGTDDRGGTVTKVITTASGGAYLFDNLRPGDYKVTFGNQAGATVYTRTVIDSAVANDGNDSDGNATTGQTTTYTLVANQNNLTVDQGLYLPISLGDRVYLDVNRDGVQQAGDTGFVGEKIVVTYLGLDGVVGGGDDKSTTVTTVANGIWTLTNQVPGNYIVQSLAPTGFALTDSVDNGTLSTTNPVSVTAPSGSNITNLDFGYNLPLDYSVGGNIFFDSNNDGDIASEVLITGQPITLVLSGTDAAGNPVSRTVTTTNGSYNFTNLPASNGTGYTVTQFNQPTGFLDGKDKAGTPFGGTVPTIGDVINGIVIASGTPTGTAGVNYNFGELLPASLGNFVWLDVNGNGRQDGGTELGIDGITVTLNGTDDRGGTVTKVITTASGGAYLFDNLRPGDYKVTFGNQAGATVYTRTVIDSAVANDGNDSDGNPTTGQTTTYTLVANQNNLTVDQGLYLPISLGNRVFFDANGDGLQQSSEPGLPGSKINVTWYGPDGVAGGGDDVTFPTVTAGVDGIWNLGNLPPGKFSVASVPNTGLPVFTDSLDDTVLSPVNPVEIVAPSGTTRFDIDFGYRGNASLGDLVWHDINANGVQDAGEPGLSGIPVVLEWFGVDGQPGGGDDYTTTTATDASGKYLFSNLPAGNYRVTVNTTKLPGNFVQTFDLDGTTTPNLALTDLVNAQDRRDVDYGYRGVGTIGDLVWYDVDGNGVQDNSAANGFEPGIAGAKVVLDFGGADGDLATVADNLSYTTTTDANGKYLFTGLFTPGTGTPNPTSTPNYRVTVTPPAVYTTQTFDADGLATANTSVLQLTSTAPSNLNQDFGYRGLSGLGNFVWLDANGNGRQDTGESGINGITVRLLDANGKVLDVKTTVNDSKGNAGFYEYPNLIPGNYIVEFGNTAGQVTYTRTRQGSAVATFETDSNANTTTGQSSIISLGNNQFNPTIDAGLFLPTSLGDTVWFDINRDGKQQTGEPGLPGVVVILDDAGIDGMFGTTDDKISVASMTTNSTGIYNFTNLSPSNYRVRVNTGTLPNGITTPTFDLDGLTTPNSADGAVASGTPRLDFDFGYAGTATLGDTVWLDLDKNGKQNNNEPGIAGTQVTLQYAGFDGKFGTADDIAFGTQTTDASGKYLFSNLPAGDFRAVVLISTLPENLAATYDLDSGLDSPDSEAVASLTTGQNRRDVDFGYTGTGSIGDRIWLDRDGDGNQDPGEPGLPNVPVKLIYAGPDNKIGTADDVSLTTTTNAQGIYAFDGLPAGTYVVMPNPNLPGFNLTGDPQGPLDGMATVPLTTGQKIDTVDFGYNGISSLSGQVYVDTNNNGVRDAGEAPIPGTVITLRGIDTLNNTFTRTTTTGSDGSYRFDALVPGTYTVVETQPTLYADGKDKLGTVNGTPNGTLTNDRVTGIVLTANQTGINYDFGEIPASIGGQVFYDRDQDGILDPNETPIPGVIVTLRGPNNTTVTATTGADGKYLFPNLIAGDYTVTETQPTGFGNPPSGPFAPNLRPIMLPAGGTRLEENFGDTLGTLSGGVYVDANNDGIRQPTEAPIPGTRITLVETTSGRTVGTTTTDASGNYSFTELPAGIYRIIQTQPVGFDDGKDTPGSLGGTVPTSDNIATINLAPGSSGVANNFGELVSNISGISYYDRNNNGAFDPATDRPLAGTVITLRNGTTVVATATTGADGSYRFPNLPSGTYTITETQPAGYGNSQTPTNIITLTVPPNTTLTNNNFGNTFGSLAGKVYVDFDLSGEFNNTGANPDTPLPGIVVTLLDGDGTSIRTATTDTNGNYLFTELPLGTYTVVETQPPLPTTLTNGFYDGADNLGSLAGTQPVKNSLRTTIGTNPNDPTSLNGVNYNFGELPPADPFGFVYNDLDRDGIRETGEPGIPNVTITLAGTAFAGTQFARPLTAADVVGGLTRQTDANGRWEFVPIPPGLYTITETQPAGFVDGLEQNGDTNPPNTVVVGNDVFSNIELAPFPIRGPFNFGEFRVLTQGPLPPIDFFPPIPVVPPVAPVDPTKREFLSSTPEGVAPVAPPVVAPVLPTAPAFGAFSPSNTRTPQYLAVAEDTGDGIVRVFDYAAGVERFRFRPFPDFTGGIRVATADITGDNIPEFVVTPGAGGGPLVRMYDGSTGTEVATWFAFEQDFRGGLQIAAGDFNGDGRADIVVTPDAGGGPIVRGYDGRTLQENMNFFALDDTFRGGLRLGTGDLNNDNADDLLVTAGLGGGPRVAGYDGRTLGTTQARLFGDFFGFAPELRNGFWISGGDVNGDGFADIVLGAGLGGGPRIAVYSGQTLTTTNTQTILGDYFGGDIESREGARVKALDLNGDGRSEVISTGGGISFPAVFTYNPLTGQRLDAFYAFAALQDQSVYLG